MTDGWMDRQRRPFIRTMPTKVTPEPTSEPVNRQFLHELAPVDCGARARSETCILGALYPEESRALLETLVKPAARFALRTIARANGEDT